MKESHHDISSSDNPDIIFDSPKDGFHTPLYRKGDHHSYIDLEQLASGHTSKIGIRVRGCNYLPRFSIPSLTFANLIVSLDRRIADLAANHTL